MVLDSSTGGLDRRSLRDQGPAAEAALDEWAAWTAARDDRYHLGTDAAAVRATVERLIAHVARQPITLDVDGRSHVVDDHTLPLLLQRWLNQEDDDASLAEAVRALADAAAGHPITPSPELVGRLALFDAEDPMLENGLAAIWANMCADSPWPAGAHRYWPEVQRSRRTQPVFGPLANHVRPCAFWPEAGKPPVEIGNAVPLLMVQAERDNATTLADARRLHERLTGSRLVTADVRAHGVYGRGLADTHTPIPCIDRTVNAYLADGTLPPHDTSCG